MYRYDGELGFRVDSDGVYISTELPSPIGPEQPVTEINFSEAKITDVAQRIVEPWRIWKLQDNYPANQIPDEGEEYCEDKWMFDHHPVAGYQPFGTVEYEPASEVEDDSDGFYDMGNQTFYIYEKDILGLGNAEVRTSAEAALQLGFYGLLRWCSEEAARIRSFTETLE